MGSYLRTCIDLLVLQQVVQYVNGGLTGGEYVLDEFHGAAADGHELRIGIGILNLRHQEIQTAVDYAKWGPVVMEYLQVKSLVHNVSSRI